MRGFLLAMLFASAVGFANASEPVGEAAPSLVDFSEAATGVSISAIPTPASVVEVLRLEPGVARQVISKKIRVAKKPVPPTLMLTRTERRQMALMLVANNQSEPQGLNYFPDDNSQGGLDQLDLHRFYSRPRLASSDDEDNDGDAVSPYVRMRLLMARLRALEVHALQQVQDDGEALPERVSQRLRSARELALAAHLRKFS